MPPKKSAQMPAANPLSKTTQSKLERRHNKKSLQRKKRDADGVFKEPNPSLVASRVYLPDAITANYDVGEQIGEGAFSIVKSGVERATNTPVAIKLVNSRMTNLQSLNNEIKFTQTVGKHALFMQFLASSATNEGGVLVMPLAHGNLAKYLKEHGWKAKSVKEKMMFTYDPLFQLAVGIQYLHRQKIAHRDLKPDNLLVKLVDPDRIIIKIADLGLAIHVTKDDKYGVGGTIITMAPEVARGEKYGCSVDVYGFGAIMFYLFIGGWPFYVRGPNRDADMRRLVQDARASFKTVTETDGKYHELFVQLLPHPQNLLRSTVGVNSAVDRLTIDQVLEDPMWIEWGRVEQCKAKIAEEGTAMDKWRAERAAKLDRIEHGNRPRVYLPESFMPHNASAASVTVLPLAPREEQAAGSEEQNTRSGEHAAGSEEQNTRSGEHATGSEAQNTRSGEQATGSEEQNTRSGEQAVGSDGQNTQYEEQDAQSSHSASAVEENSQDRYMALLAAHEGTVQQFGGVTTLLQQVLAGQVTAAANVAALSAQITAQQAAQLPPLPAALAIAPPIAAQPAVVNQPVAVDAGAVGGQHPVKLPTGYAGHIEWERYAWVGAIDKLTPMECMKRKAQDLNVEPSRKKITLGMRMTGELNERTVQGRLQPLRAQIAQLQQENAILRAQHIDHNTL